MAFSCFKLKDPTGCSTIQEKEDDCTDGAYSTRNTLSSATNRLGDSSSAFGSHAVDMDTAKPIHSSDTSSTCQSLKTDPSTSTSRLRPITLFRHAGFSATFSSCVSHENNRFSRPESEAKVDCTFPSIISPQSQPTQTPFMFHSSPRNPPFGCLVRSQSDSTCLSLKGVPKMPTHNALVECESPSFSGLDISHDSSSSNLDLLDTPLRTDASEAYATAYQIPLVGLNGNLSSTCEHISGFIYGDGSLSSNSPLPTDLSSCCGPKPSVTPRNYQLVCRDGIHRYELATIYEKEKVHRSRSGIHSSVFPSTSVTHSPSQTIVDSPSSSGLFIHGNPRSGQSMFQSQVGGFTPTPASRGFSESYHTNLTPARNNPTGFTTASVSVCSPVNVIPCSTPNRTVLTRHANPDSLREDHHVNGGQQIARHKPAAPLPSRKHRAKSPPIVSTNTTGYWLPGERLAHVSSFDPRVVVQSPSEVTNSGVPKSQRSFRVDDSDHMYGQASSSCNSSFISNSNSADNNDLSVSVGPRRPCALSNFSPTDTTALGSPTITTYHNLRDLTVSQATVVLAPENSTTSGGVVAASNEPRDMHHTRCSSGTPAPSTTDSSSRMTVSELRSVAERQRQQLMRQAQQIQAKEERLAWLRSLHTSCAVSGSTGLAQTPASGSELTHEQEVLLHKLRGFRGQTEHTRLTNETIVKEIDNLSRSLSSKEVELTAYLQRSDAARQLLPILSACHLCLSGNSSGRAHRIYAPSSDDCVNLEKPLDLLSFHLPFSSDRDKKHWRDGLLEADRLDKQIALALNHNAASQMKRAMTTSEELKNSDRTVSNAHMTFNARKPALVEFNQSVVHNKYPTVSKSNDDPASMSSKPPFVSSDFSSLLSRASSPPASRRSLRMLLHAANLGGISSVATSHTTPTSSGIVSSTLPRIKTPPRYASRAVINDTYMRRICRDSVEKYKRTASEIYRANMERLSAKQTSSLATSEPNSESHRPEEVDTDVVVVQPCHEPSELRVSPTNFAHLTLRQPITSSLQSASFDPASSSSSSSLELLGIDESSVCPGQLDEPVVRDKTDSKLTAAGSGDLDSGIGASDDATPSEHANITGLCTSHPNTALASATVVFIDDGPGTDGCLSNASDGTSQRVQSILRKAVKHSTSEMASTTATELTNDQPSTLNSSSQSRSNSVRFHPLALLLDAALEGDLDLVKKMAAAVTDVSEPNDEGITALHNAVCAGRTDIADFLVRTAGADVNAGDTDGWTPLHCAASCANLTLARLLVEHGASLHARTLSDHETPLEKCDQGDDEAECEEYLFFQQERLGSAASGRVYALFPRGLEAAGAGSADAYIQSDELPIYPNEPLTIVDREPAGEPEWMMAEKADGTHGLVPRSHISCYPLVRVPPASHPVPILPPVATRFEIWDDDEEDDTSSPVAEEPADTQASGDDTIPLVIEVDVSVADLPMSSGHTLPVVTRPTCSTTVMLRNDQLAAQSENIGKRLVTPTPTPRDGNNCDLKTAL